LFEQLLEVFVEIPGVALGRHYGRWCIKLRRHPFIALDGELIAFCVGSAAPALVQQLPRARLWNPRAGRQPKQSWIAHPTLNHESIATLGALAYGRASKFTG
jgi:hypothetical protein